MPTYKTKRRVEFCDTDAGGIMHFSGYFRLMEQAEHEMLRDLGVSVVSEHEGRTISWPRVSAKCDFAKPARFEDEFEIEIGVARIGKRSVTYRGKFWLGGDLAAEAELVAVCCVIEPGKALESIDIPDSLSQKLKQYEILNGGLE